MNRALADSGQALDTRHVVVQIEPRLVSVTVAARIYGLSVRTIEQLIADDGFPTVRIGRRVLIPVAQADRWIERVAA
jgi:excisionase family DNA binding protein